MKSFDFFFVARAKFSWVQHVHKVVDYETRDHTVRGRHSQQEVMKDSQTTSFKGLVGQPPCTYQNLNAECWMKRWLWNPCMDQRRFTGCLCLDTAFKISRKNGDA